jgi:hypothetical protein
MLLVLSSRIAKILHPVVNICACLSNPLSRLYERIINCFFSPFRSVFCGVSNKRDNSIGGDVDRAIGKIKESDALKWTKGAWEWNKKQGEKNVAGVEKAALDTRDWVGHAAEDGSKWVGFGFVGSGSGAFAPTPSLLPLDFTTIAAITSAVTPNFHFPYPTSA